MSTEGTMGAWEKATTTLAPKTTDYGTIGRAQGTGLNLVDLNTESMIQLVKELRWTTRIRAHYRVGTDEDPVCAEDENTWPCAVIRAKELLDNYDKFKQQTTPRL